MTKRMIIIGGGIIGASFAWHLRRQGVDDLMVMAEALPGDPKQATSGTWGWVNGYADDDPEYAAFRLASLRYWPQMISQIEGLQATTEGAYIWDLDETALPKSIHQHRDWGHDVSLVNGADIRSALPALKTCPGQAGLGRHDLAIEGRTAARAMLSASGVPCHEVKINRLIRQGSRITGVETDQGIIAGDEIILAAGLGTPALLNGIDVDFAMRSSLGLLAYTQALPPLLDHPVAGLDFHVRQDQDGRLVIGEAFTATADDDPDPQTSAENLVAAMAARLELSNFDDQGDIRLDHFTLGRRPLPIDGRPKIGRVHDCEGEMIDGLYMAVMHSGVTNAPLAGRLGAHEVITGQRDPLLLAFLPQPIGPQEDQAITAQPDQQPKGQL